MLTKHNLWTPNKRKDSNSMMEALHQVKHGVNWIDAISEARFKEDFTDPQTGDHLTKDKYYKTNA